MKKTWKSRLFCLVLAFCTLFALSVPAFASSIADGSRSCTLTMGPRNNYLVTTAGTRLRSGSYTYTTNDGLTGPGYCIDHGLAYTSKVLPITGKYAASPATAGAFASGYPQHDLETFFFRHLEDNPILEGLTEEEYAYATQIAIWATLGQIAVDGTVFDSGRERLAEPEGDLQQMRVFRAIQMILETAAGWDRVYQPGMYIRMDENRLGGNLAIPPDMTLEYAADNEQYGVLREVINGKSYYTKEYIFASATSTYYQDYTIDLWAEGAPNGAMFADLNNVELPRSKWNSIDTWRLPVEGNPTVLNGNGFEYSGTAKLCIPVETAPPRGEITLHCAAQVMQYEIYLANNTSSSEQSYILADPSKGTAEAQAVLSWGSEITEFGTLQILKVGSGGSPLAGAVFTLTGTDGTERTGRTDSRGIIHWTGLRPGVTYTLKETEPPAGYAVVDAITVTVQAARTTYLTVRDDPQHTLTVRKIDRQTGYSLRGASICFEQIDGSFRTTKVTDHAGSIQMNADQLPVGSYRVYEIAAPEGYELDSTVQTVHWDGRNDVTLIFRNTRKPTLIISKKDSRNGYALPDATFEVYRDGALVTTVTTNDNGLAYVSGVTNGYYEVKETIAPLGYVLNTEIHGVNIDLYDPATTNDPRLVVLNDPMPSLRIVKYDRQSGKPLAGVAFKVYCDTVLVGTYTTDRYGEIYLTGLEAGTYLVQEVATDDEHVVDSTPQQIELRAGQTETAQLVFFNSLKPGIHLIKVDSVTMKSLPNVRFEFALVGGSYRQEFVTDINGEIDLSRLEPGAYQVRELEAPEGYLIDNAIRVIQLVPDEDASFVFTNTPKPSLRLIKTSSDGSRLAGVQFRIAKIEDGTHYLDRITDQNGEINISGLEPGVYSVQETATVSDHVLNTKEYHVELFPGQTSTICLENQKRPNLTIRKTDKDTGAPVPGVTFTLRGADGPTITTEPTGADGTVRITDLLPGTYTVTEQSVPECYILDATPQTVTLFANREAQVEFQNYQRPTLKIAKVDVNGRPLTGAIFTVTTKARVKIGDFPVGADGTVTVSNVHLSEGYYIITEKQAPAGYILDTTIHEVYLRPGKTTEISIENEKKPGLTIYKVDSVVGDGIKGAKFEIWVSKDKDQNGTYRKLDSNYYYSDENGVIHLENLDTGWYKIIEVEPPAGYMLKGSAEQVVYVEHDASVEVTIENNPKSALVIRKTDAATGAPLANAWFRVRYLGGTSGSGGTVIGEYQTSANGNIIITGLDAGAYVAEEISAPHGYVMDTSPQTAYISGREQDCITLSFTNSKNGALLIKKVDSITGQPLSDVQFFVTDSDGKTLGNANGYFTTDSAGTILIPDIEPGTTLVVKETRAKPGYVLDGTAQTVRIKSDEAATLEFRNQPTGSLLIQKVCAVNPSVTLQDAEFKVIYADGAVVGVFNGIYRTDEAGEILISGLIPGRSVVITETRAPAGFLIDTQPQTVVIQAGKTVGVTMKNQPMGQLIIQKRDSQTGQHLSGAEFRITTAAGCEVGLDGVIGTSTLTSNGIFTTDSNGEIHISNLAPGAYVLTEVKAPAGYVMDAPSTNVVIGTGGDTQVVVVTNTPKGNLVVEKYDSVTKQPLSGAQFKITTASGEVVADNEGLTGSNGLYITDVDGRIVLSKLLPGTYVVSEVKAPDNYQADSTPQTVVVNAGNTQTIRFYNDPLCTLTILKRDAVTQKPLKGAEFTAKDSEGRTIGRYTTGTDGTVIVSGLTPDATYVVSESKAPTGYIKDETPKNIVVRSGVSNSLTFDNEPTTTLIIRKFIEGTENEPLSGVAFKVVDGSGAAVGPDDGCYYTDKAGEIVLNDIEPGTTVIAREIKTVEGYVLDGTPQDILIKAGEVQSLTFWNKKAGALVIQKKDSVTGALIPGAQFQLTYANGGYVDNDNGHLSSNGLYTTDDKGEIRVYGITGTVVAKEVKAAPGYVIDQSTQTQTVTVNPLDTQTLTFLNAPLCSLTITKLDSVTGKPVPGTQFAVKDGNGAVLGRYTTGKDGTVVVTGLVPGSTIVVVETKVPSGYVLNSTPQTIIVKNGSNTVSSGGAGTVGGNTNVGTGTNGGNDLVFENDPTTRLVIEKYITGTTTPLKGVTFLVTESNGKVLGSDNGEYTTDENGRIVIEGLEPGVTIIAREIRTLDGYILDTTPKTIQIKVGAAQTLRFYNSPIGGLELIKVSESNKSQRIPNTTFEIRRMDGGLVETVTTDKNGRVYVVLDAGDYYAVEVQAADGLKLDTTPHYFTIRDGKTTTLTVTNAPFSGIIIHKVDSVTGEGICDVKFLVYDQNKNPIAEYYTDDRGYICIDDLTVKGTSKLFIRELEAAPGYELDKEYKTVYLQPGKTIEIEWQNTPITGQFQVYKFAAEYNEITGTSAGTPLQGAVYEISEARSGKVVDYITTDARGVAASKPLPLGRYKITEVTAPTYWQLSGTVFDETLEYSGQIIKLSDYDKPVTLGVSITKQGNYQVLAGNQMRYDFTVANTSCVALENFFWHDRIPTDATRATVFTTGTYSARLNYRILYKTNYSASYQVLASNLLTTNNYSFSLNAIPVQAGEYVTDIYLDFGKVPVGFQSTSKPTLTVQVLGTVANGYQIVNRADVGGRYQDTWQTAQASWVTLVRKLTNSPTLPKTGY